MIEWFILLQPIIDFLTSLSVRFVEFPLTFGIIVRVLFTGLICFYMLFLYKGKQKKRMVGYLIGSVAYGILFIGLNAYFSGVGTVAENGKMFFKIFYFLFVLFFFYARYLESGHLISDKLLTIVFVEYAVSIFASAVTDTSFVSYEFAEGYVGWFYAANEIGAVVAMLAPVALLYIFEIKNLWIKLGVGFLVCFTAVYIGTKVPFYSIVGAAVMLFVFYGIKTLTARKGWAVLVQGAATLLVLMLLYQINSPMKQNTTVFSGDNFDSHVTDKLESETPDESLDEIGADGDVISGKGYLVLNWFLSDRLYYAENAISAYANADTIHKLFGLGNHFQLKDGRTLIEMDFLALLINNGVLGLVLYLIPILYFAALCIFMLFKNIRHILRMQKELLYTYVVLIGLGAALVAGHVLVAPAVSVYVAILIVKLYASLKNEEYKELSK
ncbi:MAG: O-antigen ligase family protein [Clostridia bacterium]|nr:O-antigen ligase family protein [Clostridia bacterium]